MRTDAAQRYSDVFTPGLFVLLCGVCPIGYEWCGPADRSAAGLGARLGVLALGVAFVAAYLQYDSESHGRERGSGI